MRNDQIEASHRSLVPLPPVRVLVEDKVVACADEDLTVPPGFEVTVCSGPFSASEVCPLVTERACPHGTPDVVVSNLDGRWAQSVRAAWIDAGVPLVAGTGDGSAQRRLDRAIGAAVSAFFPGSAS